MSYSNPGNEIWKSSDIVQRYLPTTIRGSVPLAEEQFDVLKRLAGALDRPVRRFLDLGCGDGVLARVVYDAWPESEGVVQDFSQAMLDAAYEKLADHVEHTLFVHSDFSEAGWDGEISGKFDLIVSGYSIHHQPDSRKQTLYTELFDMLAPGGLFVNIEHVASASDWVQQRYQDLVIDCRFALGQAKGLYQSREEAVHAYNHREDRDANVLTPVETQCVWLRESGFEDVDCFLKIFELAVFGGRRPERA
jgi:tRNA (cmo5U34)-methyltransferase